MKERKCSNGYQLYDEYSFLDPILDLIYYQDKKPVLTPCNEEKQHQNSL